MVKIYLSLLFSLAITTFYAQGFAVVDFKIQGLKRTKISEVKKLIKVRAGMPLDSVLMQDDMERLKRLPSISHAYFKVFSLHDGRHNVYYYIEENFTLIPFANLYSSSNDDFAFRIGVEEFNFLGRNIQIGGFYQFDVFSSFGLNHKRPKVF